MLSRVADAIFWISRYMERTKIEATFLHTNYVAIQDNAIENNWKLILEKYGSKDYLKKNQKSRHEASETLLHLLIDKNNPASILNNVMYARENARSVQDNITKELWQMLNNFHHTIRHDKNDQILRNDDPVEVLDVIQQQCYLYSGTVDYTMDRGPGYYFLNVGKRIERTMQSIQILKIKLKEIAYDLDDDSKTLSFRYVLYALSGNELYGKTYRGALSIRNIINFVLFSPIFTNSVQYSLGRIRSSLNPLKDESRPEAFSQVEFEIGRIISSFTYSKPDMNDGEHLAIYLDSLEDDVLKFSSHFSTLYFK